MPLYKVVHGKNHKVEAVEASSMWSDDNLLRFWAESNPDKKKDTPVFSVPEDQVYSSTLIGM